MTAILAASARYLGRYSRSMEKPSWRTRMSRLRVKIRARPSQGSPKKLPCLPRGV